MWRLNWPFRASPKAAADQRVSPAGLCGGRLFVQLAVRAERSPKDNVGSPRGEYGEDDLGLENPGKLLDPVNGCGLGSGQCACTHWPLPSTPSR